MIAYFRSHLNQSKPALFPSATASGSGVSLPLTATISDAGLLGGGTNPGPSEVSLAHNVVLFLDELPEFRRSTLEVMRQPLEDGKVTISYRTLNRAMWR